ncbi:MAG: Rpn family recombination-promoting nuclease/putative transposase [Cellulosilyticaceae bacterium]
MKENRGQKMEMKKDLNNIHDKTYKSFFENSQIFLEMLQSFVKEEWAYQLTAEGLVQDKSYYVIRDYEEMEADVVYTATIDGQEVIFYILLELQSTVDYSMPIRLFTYTSEIWRKYLKKHTKEEVKRKDFKLPAVVPIILYNGEAKWTVEKSFKEKIHRADLFGNHVIDFEYILINVNKFKEEDLMAIENVVSAIFLLDQKVDAKEFVRRAANVVKEFQQMPAEHKLKLIDWIDHTVENPIREEVIKLFHANKEEVDLMTANITRTMQEEKEHALLEGEFKGQIKIAKRMLEKGVSIEEIIEFTGLTTEEIETLRTAQNRG